MAIAFLLIAVAMRAESAVWERAAEIVAPAELSADGAASRRASGGVSLALMPERYDLYRLDDAELKRALEAVATKPVDASSSEFAAADSIAKSISATDPDPRIIALPFPGGEMVRLRLEKTDVLAPELGALHPEISTYSARGVEDPSIFGNLDLTPKGFHGLLFTRHGEVFIDPRSDGVEKFHVSYYRKDYLPQEKSAGFSCGVDRNYESVKSEFGYSGPMSPQFRTLIAPQQIEFNTGNRLKEYRIAVAATAEYTAFHDDPNNAISAKDDALAAIVTTINRVNTILQRDFSIRLNIVANNKDVIFTNPATDGLSNGNSSQLLSEVRPILDTEIGSANYDIGHVFHVTAQFTGSGIAYVGVVCDPRADGVSRKSQGVSGSWQPVGDAFDIELVAHEIGHQLGGTHTFNSTQGSCNGSRDNQTAVEPGSGSTIMSYAGICGSDNLQSDADFMFSATSIEQTVEEYNSGWAGLCPVETDIGNEAPVAAGTGTFEIPSNTPFELTGSGSDPDTGDVLTYSWEQQDSGSASNVDVDTGNNAIFRAFEPVDSPDRIFPRLDKILGTSSAIGEVLPSTNRQLNFRLVVRDQNGGVDDSSLTVNVTDNSATGFRITAPNVSQSYSPGEAVTVTWDRAGTHQAPINCSDVALSFSTDGGQTFGAGGEQIFSNTGSAVATIPGNATSTGRFKLKCVGNIFFDISDADLTVADAPEISVSGDSVEIADGDTSPSQADDTDFGDIAVSESQSHAFVISNPGSQSLLLTGNPRVTLSGPNANQFSVVQLPGTPVAVGGTRTFIISFAPDSVGLKQATITIPNNDSDENPYNFSIQGTGVDFDISVLGNNIEIADGDSTPSGSDGTDFGSVAVNGGTAAQSFDIVATAGEVQLTGNPRVQISGAHAGDFSVTSNAQSVTSPGSPNPFTIAFDPSAPGLRAATIVIPNNDPDEDPYNFAIQGTGLGADLSLDINDLSDPIAPGDDLDYTLTVTNLGPAGIQGTTVEVTLDDDLLFTGGSGCTQPTGQPVICQVGALNANQNVQINLSTALDIDARGSVGSSALVVNNGSDPVTVNNSDSETTSINLVAPSLSISLGANPVETSSETSLRISVNNAASMVDATGIGFNLILPAGVLVAADPQINDGCSGSPVVNGSRTQFNYGAGSVSAGQVCMIAFKIVADSEGAYPISVNNLTSSSGASNTAATSLTVQASVDDEMCVPVKQGSKVFIICL